MHRVGLIYFALLGLLSFSLAVISFTTVRKEYVLANTSQLVCDFVSFSRKSGDWVCPVGQINQLFWIFLTVLICLVCVFEMHRWERLKPSLNRWRVYFARCATTLFYCLFFCSILITCVRLLEVFLLQRLSWQVLIFPFVSFVFCMAVYTRLRR
jgi:hypothetical protein